MKFRGRKDVFLTSTLQLHHHLCFGGQRFSFNLQKFLDSIVHVLHTLHLRESQTPSVTDVIHSGIVSSRYGMFPMNSTSLKAQNNAENRSMSFRCYQKRIDGFASTLPFFDAFSTVHTYYLSSIKKEWHVVT